MSKSSNILTSINELDIKKDSIYKITNRLDMNAPSGYRNAGTTKLPSDGVGNSIPCKFVIRNHDTGDGVFDTGLYIESPMYRDVDKAKVKRIVKELKEVIVEPYESKYGVGTLDHTNTEFWDTFNVDLFDGRFLNTGNIDDLLDLFIAMVGAELTPKGFRGDPRFISADYMIIDKDKVKSAAEERNSSKIDAIGAFSYLLKAKKPLLLNVLRYIGGASGVDKETNDSTLKSIFAQWIEVNPLHANKFNDAIEFVEETRGAQIISIYGRLDKLMRKNKFVSRSESSGMIEFSGTVIGTDLRDAATNIFDDKELEEIQQKLVDLED